MLDSTQDLADTHGVTRSPPTKTEPTVAASGRASEPLTDRVTTNKGVRAAPKGGRVGSGVGERMLGLGGAVESPANFDLGMPISRSKIQIDRNVLAAFHEQIARLLREGCGDERERDQRTG